MDTDGMFYASIGYTYVVMMDMNLRTAVLNDDKEVLDSLSYLGLDYSQDDFYVDNEGRKANYPHYYRKSEEKLAKLQHELSKMEKDSNNYKKQQNKIARLHKKIRNQRKDFVTKKAVSLAREYDVVIVEDINLRAMGECLKLGKNLHDNGFGMFRNVLSRKLEEKGSVLVKIDKWYPSTQTCHCCGYVNKETKDLAVRAWDCPECGMHHDRDVNAAINIRDEGMRIALA
jgi:putative transposase